MRTADALDRPCAQAPSGLDAVDATAALLDLAERARALRELAEMESVGGHQRPGT